MSFLTHVIESLPGSKVENPLMGGRTMTDFANQTLTGNLSENALNAINATDPTIQSERAINKIAGRDIFSEDTQQKQSTALNTIGKLIASWYIGGQAGGAASAAGASPTVAGAATGAAVGGSSAAFNDQNIAQGALYGGLVGGIGGAMASEPIPLASGGEKVASSTASATPSSTEVMKNIGKEVISGAGQGAVASTATGGNAGEGAAKGAIGGLIGGVVGEGYDKAVTDKGAVSKAAKGAITSAARSKARGENVSAGAITGLAGTGLESTLSHITSPALQGAIGGAVMAGLGATLSGASGKETENAIYGGSTAGLLGGTAYEAAGGGETGKIASAVGRGAGTNLAMKTLPNKPEMPVNPEFEKYMKYLQRGYSPAITNDLNPLVLASLTLDQENIEGVR